MITLKTEEARSLGVVGVSPRPVPQLDRFPGFLSPIDPRIASAGPRFCSEFGSGPFLMGQFRFSVAISYRGLCSYQMCIADLRARLSYQTRSALRVGGADK